MATEHQCAGSCAAHGPNIGDDIGEESLPAGVTRREFASVAAAAAAGLLATACGNRRLHDIPKDKLKIAVAEMEQEYSAKYGKAVTVSGAGPN